MSKRRLGQISLRLLVSLCLVVGLMPMGAWALEAASVELGAGSGASIASSSSGTPQATALDPQRVGIGGGGALFDPAISPFDSNDMALGIDMGDLYVTRDGGGSWAKKTVGRVYDIQYDPTREGVVYACGSGIWRSTDYGENFELMWPKRESITGVPMKYEDFRYYFFNTDGYDPLATVTSIAVDRANNDVIYALGVRTRYDENWVANGTVYIVYRSTNGGGSFEELARYEIDSSFELLYDNSKLVVHDGAVWLCTQAGIFAYEEGSQALKAVYEPDGITYPVKLDVVYPTDEVSRTSGADRTFWVACFGKGFYRSTDSGVSFAEVNDGVADRADDMVYAADIEVNENGSQVFGMTARRADRGIAGKVYRFDDARAQWVEISLPSEVMDGKTLGVTRPRDIFWDEASETLYISCVASNASRWTDASQPDFYNHHGGIYVWHPGDAQAAALDAGSEAVRDASSVEGVAIDGAGNLFASDSRGNIWLRRAVSGSFEKIYDRFHVISKGVQIVSESVKGGLRVDTIALPTFGGGTLNFDVNGSLDKALLRGGFRFTSNVVRLNCDVGADALFSIAGNVERTVPVENKLYVLPDDVVISGNKIFAQKALRKGLKALNVFDASFAGHAIDFRDNRLWATADQESAEWPLVCVQDVQGEAPTVDVTGTASNLFNKLSFYRTSENDEAYGDYGATLVHPKVLLGGREYTGTQDHWTKHSLATEAYTSCEWEGHLWDAPTYAWSADNAACTARRVCTRSPEHVEEETASATAMVTQAATCSQKGETTYTAAFAGDGFATQTVTLSDVPLDPDAHEWGAWTVKRQATATQEGQRERACSWCGATQGEAVPIAPSDDVVPSANGASPAEAALSVGTSSQAGTSSSSNTVPSASTATRISIAAAKISGVKSVTYNGKPRTQSLVVKVGKKVLKAGVDYSVSYRNNVRAGAATATVSGEGGYTGSRKVTFAIAKARNPMTVRAKSPSVKAAKVKRAKQVLPAKRVFTVGKAQGKVTYRKLGGAKGIAVSSGGKVTVRKGLGKGAYKIKVRVAAKGNANYKPGSKTVTAKVRVA